MKTHINLLTKDERRDPSGVLIRTTLDTLLIAAAIALVLYGALAYITLHNAQLRQRRAEAQWNTLKPDFERSKHVRVAYENLERITAELAAFSNVQASVASRLLVLAQCVPADIQLLDLSLNQSQVDDDGAPARQYELQINGRTASEDSNARVEGLIKALQAVPEPDDFGTVSPRSNLVDPQSKGTLENVFEVRCLFAPRRYQWDSI